MESPIIHIGYHKTGTTWFQNNFYPKITNIQYIDRNFVQNLFIKERSFHFDENEVKKNLSTNFINSKRIVLCEEELSGNIHSGGLHGCLTKEMSYRIKAVFPNGKIIIFIRNQIDMITSIYLQYLKKGGNYNINEYLYHTYTHNNRFPLFSFEHLNYIQIITHYETLFGKENVHVYLYEDFLKDNDQFIKNFASEFNLEYSFKDMDFSKRNIKYKRCTFHLSKLLNSFTKHDVLNKYYLINVPYLYDISRTILKKLDKALYFDKAVDNESVLGNGNIKYIKKYYKLCNNELKSKYKLDLDYYDYPL
ncbi:hypothetical protein J7W08_09485 [Methanococcoides orientis]|uniref:sulfotransferase domain-containing protein n=1 Tax=Methanococcoides orientis TaxID=2822137 RepID=UPI001E4D4905|nr:sulfotransferase domain-containing protein [Methanococcoides orientis]UGV40305.1 hypothetical protein J7W08_09485 [Methanococcoides orientis]